TFLVRRSKTAEAKSIQYLGVSDYANWREKQKFLVDAKSLASSPWQTLTPDAKGNWLTQGMQDDFDRLRSIGGSGETLFNEYCCGIATSRDAWAYNFNRECLSKQIAETSAFFNEEVDRFQRSGKNPNLDDFVRYNDKKISWSRDLKLDLVRGRHVNVAQNKFREALYRPYCKQNLFFDRVLNEEVYIFEHFLPTLASETENVLIGLTGIGSEKPFMCLAGASLMDLHLSGAACRTQCFPFYTYGEDGSNRRENITDRTLNEFRTHYKDQKLSKWDIFHYIYGLLHSPEYRERYSANLKRELPRIPFAPDFWAFAKAGERLTDLHVNYEKQPEYALERVENPKEKLSYRVEKMRLSKDKSALTYNSFWTLRGIPPETYEYRLGNRSALEWVVDQYQISTDKRSGIVNDPNREDDPGYILRLIGQVIYVSLETVKIVKALPALGIAQSAGAGAAE
ncbi:MAG TPA: type ISP restriction/modification enzyme, partial [Terriglobales bacterium]|nr:type ISP restriction/modification enzyme [Terriglobales bacterium]